MAKLIKILQWIRKFFKRLFWFTIFSIIGILVISVLLVLSMRWINPIGTSLMVERKIESWQAGDGLKFQREWKGWYEISDSLKLAVIASEDQNFPYHHGFDMEAIQQALKHNADGGNLRGASTISQQVSKNIFLWSGRSWFRKGVEVWFTAWIELLWSKERILEVYLNSAEWGDGIFGAEAAAQYYFNTTARKLTKEQASLLAAVLPNPRNWNPAKPTVYINSRGVFIRKQMDNLGGNAFLQKLRCGNDCPK
ncbi:monofunctional biosynthetic peptidoglycan transglycosylase [Entomomonas sp. E2T0]|uniref:monofunctional biosynthetic peptidoglycan transglycosylase n=1 Tax=Entomomonas sp. E2T0 TaxID=2930213 RepID=UPI0022282612|nr:monofunctional biosynthetic peptidoglycan transglycosylase [Entomomonas sp. E2T0]UYZ83955.1 monofunctional biosynthetic peptidoglycan transglycosylase [Entomomonas sp. E2T0]